MSVFVFLFFCYVVWRKYKKHKKHKKPEKQWEGKNPNKRKKSIEELRQHESRFRGPGGGSGM